MKLFCFQDVQQKYKSKDEGIVYLHPFLMLFEISRSRGYEEAMLSFLIGVGAIPHLYGKLLVVGISSSAVCLFVIKFTKCI